MNIFTGLKATEITTPVPEITESGIKITGFYTNNKVREQSFL